MSKVLLRKPSTQKDFELQSKWRNSDLAHKAFYTEPKVTPRSTLDWYMANWVHDPHKHYFMIDAIDEHGDFPTPIGVVSLVVNPKTRTAEYGHLMIGSDAHRGKGFALAAERTLMQYGFKELGLRKIWGEVLTDNQAVYNLHLKTGFKKEGTLRQHILKRGEPRDIFIMGLLKDEFIPGEQSD